VAHLHLPAACFSSAHPSYVVRSWPSAPSPSQARVAVAYLAPLGTHRVAPVQRIGQPSRLCRAPHGQRACADERRACPRATRLTSQPKLHSSPLSTLCDVHTHPTKKLPTPTLDGRRAASRLSLPTCLRAPPTAWPADPVLVTRDVHTASAQSYPVSHAQRRRAAALCGGVPRHARRHSSRRPRPVGLVRGVLPLLHGHPSPWLDPCRWHSHPQLSHPILRNCISYMRQRRQHI
jgi:hypothetical protein